MAYAALLSANSFFQDGRSTIELELYFYPFFYLIAFGLLMSVIAIIFWFLRSISEKKSEWRAL